MNIIGLSCSAITALATVLLAVAAYLIPVGIDLEQRQKHAEAWTIEYYDSVFNSEPGRKLERLGREAEVSIWRHKALVKASGDISDPDDKAEYRRMITRAADASLWREFREEYGEENLRHLAIFLLRSADILYECGKYDKLFENGYLKVDDNGKLIRHDVSFWESALRRVIAGGEAEFPLCDPASVNTLFGTRLADSLFYLRTFLYCDDFITTHYFREEGSNTPLHRLESIVMVATKLDMEFRYPNVTKHVFRTHDLAREYQNQHPGQQPVTVRLDSVCDSVRET